MSHEIDFDLDRMRGAVEGPYHEVPGGMTPEELDAWIMRLARQTVRLSGLAAQVALVHGLAMKLSLTGDYQVDVTYQGVSHSLRVCAWDVRPQFDISIRHSLGCTTVALPHSAGDRQRAEQAAEWLAAIIHNLERYLAKAQGQGVQS